MNTLISAQEAFNALRSGKTILCKKFGENEFKSLENVPASVWVLPAYEFCIKIEMTELSGIQFTKPVEPHDLSDGQTIYIVMPTCILETTYDPERADICLSVANGFAQCDSENAILQLQAIGKTFGNMITDVEIKAGFSDKPKKRRTRKSAEPEPIKSDIQAANDDTSIDDIIGPVGEQSLMVEVSTKTGDERIKEYQKLLSEIEKTPLHSEESKQSDLDDVESEPETIQQKYEDKLSELISIVENAQSIDEANEPAAHTQDWTVEQRLPLITAISKRLVELGKPLIAQIREASDLTVLDVYLNQIRELVAVDGAVAHQLMIAHVAKKAELEKQVTI